MTQEEAFKQFEKEYTYSYFAQEDGGSKSVIFSFIPKGQYSKSEEDWIPEIKFEAKSLELAFNYAFMKCGYTMYCEYEVGIIKRFSIDKWSQIEKPTHFWSLQDNCLKNLADVLEKERLENEAILLRRTLRMN